MNHQEFQALLAHQAEVLQKITATKGAEYSNDEDQLANFKRLAAELGLPDIKVCLVYLTKHLDAIKSYAKRGEVMSEPIEGRIDDAILYLILLKGLIRDRIKNEAGSSPEPTFCMVGATPVLPPFVKDRIGKTDK